VVFSAVVVVSPPSLPSLLQPAMEPTMAEVSAATVVVPDRHRQGTNALIFDAAARPEFVYGPDSLRRHAAAAAGPPVVLLPLASLARDIDTPADLAGLAGKCAAAGARETAAVMAAIGERSPTSVLKENQR
jgi:2-phospho-L-lactate guanylyltransferase